MGRKRYLEAREAVPQITERHPELGVGGGARAS